ncbi:MAG: ATP-dependent sacrificial sulfur transferase LarE [Planctomycetota bacterium]
MTITTLSFFDGLDEPLRKKLTACEGILRGLGTVVVAFSGGVDSTFLLALAVATLGRKNTLAAMGVSPSLPRREREEARALAQAIGAELLEVETGELANPSYAANPARRCFYCKDDLFSRLGKLAFSRGGAALVSGANADDSGDFRPGLEAGACHGVVNPLMQAGLTKPDIRAASQAMNLPTWDKPAMACLASRVPYGQAITAEVLARIEAAEDALKDLGFRACRVRDHAPVARIEVPPDLLAKALELREPIVRALKRAGYTFVTLDMAALRTGSMNETLTPADKSTR